MVLLSRFMKTLVDMVKKNKLGTGNKWLKGRDWTVMDVEKSNEMVDKIDKILKRKEQLRRLEEYVGGKPKTVNPLTFVRPIPACEIKLVDILEMNYTSANKSHSRGVICVKRANVFQGYYKDEFHSEDVNEGKHWRTSSFKERGNDEDMIKELADEYMNHLERDKSKGTVKSN
ncbi:retrovirus-related pol polyprotein from transposon TNT 1-94 [Tanacetum coccineum]